MANAYELTTHARITDSAVSRFDALLPQMSQIVSSFSTLETVDLSAESAEYVMRRVQQGTNKLFFIYFSRGSDGVWRIESM